MVGPHARWLYFTWWRIQLFADQPHCYLPRQAWHTYNQSYWHAQTVPYKITSRMRIQGGHSYKRKSAQNSPVCSRQGNYVAHPKVSRGSNQVTWVCKHCDAMHCVRNTVLETQRGRLGALQTNTSWFPGFSASQFHNETLLTPHQFSLNFWQDACNWICLTLNFVFEFVFLQHELSKPRSGSQVTIPCTITFPFVYQIIRYTKSSLKAPDGTVHIKCFLISFWGIIEDFAC